MQFRRRQSRTGLGIDITPLIDVVFFAADIFYGNHYFQLANRVNDQFARSRRGASGSRT